MANWQRAYWVVGMLVLNMGNIRVVQIETSGRASAQTRANLVDAIAQSPLSYRIDTLAGNGQPGDTPGSVENARKVPVDLPFGVEQGPDNAIYITTVGSHRVLRYDPRSAKITRVAGNGRAGYSGDGGQATEAMLNEPYEVRFDSAGNMLIVEMQNHVIRRVAADSGVITTIAGDGVAGVRGDGGSARRARFRYPHSITCLLYTSPSPRDS